MHQSDVKEKLKLISAERRQWDELFSELQGLIRGRASKMPVVRLRQQFMVRVERLREAVRNNSQELERLKYRIERMRQEGSQVEGTMRSIEAMMEYFKDLGRKVKEQQRKGQDQISERQRWDVSQGEHDNLQEQSQLIMSSNGAREVREQAEMVLGTLQTQGGRLQAAREKMGSVLKNINLAGNIANLIKRRSKEDNRLIMWLTLGLLLEIYLCIFYIRPFLKGQ